jgi:hypothetical protein
MVPKDTTRAVVQHEFPIAEAWASRHGWELGLDFDTLVMTCTTRHPSNREPAFLRAELGGYRAVPPAWLCVDATGAHAKGAYPAPGPLPGGKSSVFHSQPVICAPFNRLAYADGNGPHKQDWGEATNWLSVPGDFARATTLAEMLQVLETHLRFSPGWMT